MTKAAHPHIRSPPALGEFQRRLKTLRQALADVRAHHDAIDHDVDVMREFLVEHRRFGELVKRAVDLDR